VFNPLNPYKAPSPSTQRRIDGKHGEEAIVNVNISIREEKAQDAKQALEEAIAHLERDEYIGGAY
jgi:hypothetical protein